METTLQPFRIPALTGIEINYRCRDIWGDQDADPHDAFVQVIDADVAGVAYDEATDECGEIALGQLTLARIDLFRLAREGQHLGEVFDSQSSEWINSYEDFIFEKAKLLDEARWFVIADRMQLLQEARGQGIGLHVLARALRTWAAEQALIALVASSTEHELEEEAAREEASLKLARYWGKLGFSRLRKPGYEPVLYALSSTAKHYKAVQRYSTRFPA